VTDSLDSADLTNEYKAMFEESRPKYRRLSGEYSHFKGKYAAFVIIHKNSH